MMYFLSVLKYSEIYSFCYYLTEGAVNGVTTVKQHHNITVPINSKIKIMNKHLTCGITKSVGRKSNSNKMLKSDVY